MVELEKSNTRLRADIPYIRQSGLEFRRCAAGKFPGAAAAVHGRMRVAVADNVALASR
jgi:hypothetical protein